MRIRPDGAKVTPVEPGLVRRLVSGVRSILPGASSEAWMGPAEPMAPLADKPSDQTAGRQWDYPVGWNLNYRPRAPEPVDFGTLRAMADHYDLLRLVIETRKDQIARLRWNIKVRGDAKRDDPRARKISDFFRQPDRQHTWSAWLRILVEEMLVTDAACLYPRLTRGGDLYSLDLMDGATITRLIDASGRTPLPPSPAYQQVLKGVPAVNYTLDELIYAPRNERVHKVYGFSPVEQIIMTVNIALRRQANHLSYYTQGNIPNLIFTVPADWSGEQIRQMQTWWDSLMTGGSKHIGKFVPGGVNVIDTKEQALKDEFDEWLARVVCYAFSVSPQNFIKQVSKNTGETQQQMALEEGLAPLQGWVKDVIDGVIARYFGCPDIEFMWEEEEAVDPLVQAQINQIYLASNVLEPDEVRVDIGRDPFTPAQIAARAERQRQALESARTEADPSGIDSRANGKKPDQSRAAKALKKKTCSHRLNSEPPPPARSWAAY